MFAVSIIIHVTKYSAVLMTHEGQDEKYTWVTELMEVYVLQSLMWALSNTALKTKHVGSALFSVTVL